jgi:predicted DNA-binding transcriptional regulator AlpA
MATTDELQIIREAERKRLTGISRVTQWRLEQKGLAPKRVQISENAIGWIRSEIQQWIQRKANAR